MLPRNETQVAGHLTGPLKTSVRIQGGHKRTRGNRTDTGQCRQPPDRRIHRDQSVKPGVGVGDLVIEDFDQTSEWLERFFQ